MGEVKRYDMLIDYGCSKFDSPEIDPHEIKDGYWVKHSDYAALEAERDALRAEVAKLRAACAAMQERCAMACEDEARIWEADGKGPECAARLCAARIRSLPNVTDAGKGWIDATGAVETGVFWYSGRYVVEIPKSMALSRVLIVPVKQ